MYPSSTLPVADKDTPAAGKFSGAVSGNGRLPVCQRMPEIQTINLVINYERTRRETDKGKRGEIMTWTNYFGENLGEV